MRDYPQIPKISLPFRFHHHGVDTGMVAHVVEQDSIEDIMSCVEAVARTIRGERVDEPEFGITDPTFSSPHAQFDRIIAEISQWEPRARLDYLEEMEGAHNAEQMMELLHILVSGAGSSDERAAEHDAHDIGQGMSGGGSGMEM